MFRPDQGHLSELMNDVADNYDKYAELFFNQAQQVHDEYNWLNLTERAYEHIVNKFS
jgi:hypothetical protein